MTNATSGHGRARFLLVLAALCGLWLVHAADARAESCVYDAATRTLTINVDAGPDHAVVVSEVSRLADGTIQWDARGASGTLRQLAPCADGAGTVATVTNTDVVDIVGTRSGVHDGLEIFGVDRTDLRSTATSWTGTGIEFRIDFGPTPIADGDSVHVAPGGASDTITIGTGGISLDTAGTRLVMAGAEFPRVSVDGGYGSDRISAAGDASVGGPAPRPVTIQGETGADVLTGGTAGDSLDGGTGNDTLTGGAGADTLLGDSQNDTIYANDGEADARIDGGNHTDTAYVDTGIDPAPTGVEVVNP